MQRPKAKALPQELKVSPRSGLYLLVYINLFIKAILYLIVHINLFIKAILYLLVYINLVIKAILYLLVYINLFIKASLKESRPFSALSEQGHMVWSEIHQAHSPTKGE